MNQNKKHFTKLFIVQFRGLYTIIDLLKIEEKKNYLITNLHKHVFK